MDNLTPTEVNSGAYRFKVGGPGLKLATGGPRGASSAWNDHHSWGGGLQRFSSKGPHKLAGCPLLDRSIDSSATISRVQHDIAAMSHPITRVTIDVHTAPRARDATAIFRGGSLFRNADVCVACFLFCGCDGRLSLLACMLACLWPSALGPHVVERGGKSMLARIAAAAILLAPSLLKPTLY